MTNKIKKTSLKTGANLGKLLGGLLLGVLESGGLEGGMLAEGAGGINN